MCGKAASVERGLNGMCGIHVILIDLLHRSSFGFQRKVRRFEWTGVNNGLRTRLSERARMQREWRLSSQLSCDDAV